MSDQADPSGADVAAQMPALAQEFAQARKAEGLALDFLPRTLPLVDRFMKGTPGANPTAVAAYVGEVICRETSASWYDFDDGPLLSVGDYQTDPRSVV